MSDSPKLSTESQYLRRLAAAISVPVPEFTHQWLYCFSPINLSSGPHIEPGYSVTDTAEAAVTYFGVSYERLYRFSLADFPGVAVFWEEKTDLGQLGLIETANPPLILVEKYL